MKVNYKLLPVKVHYFFFMAASGAVLPYLQVMGKQLGISEVVMGSVTALLPPLYLLAKPLFGVIVDHFSAKRRHIFLLVLAGQNITYGLLYFIPRLKGAEHLPSAIVNETSSVPYLMITDSTLLPCETPAGCSTVFSALDPASSVRETWAADETTQNSLYTSEMGDVLSGSNLYTTPEFWIFVALLSFGTILFNVANSVSDAITFDILGEGQEMSYGVQRVWGTVGFGVAGLLAGIAMQWLSTGETVDKNYAPALVLAVIFGIIDLIVCGYHLQLPLMPRSNRILRDVGHLICRTEVATFLVFAAICGILDGFVIYYLFWYLEDLAVSTGKETSIKLLEGLVVAAETLIGETVFFYLSGFILRLIGGKDGKHSYARGLTLSLFSFAVRFALVSITTSPWHLLPIEAVMQGPTYALSYTAIVGYAANVSPPGASATMQGLVAGVDDGLGYAIGSLMGGVCYKYIGGKWSFQVFAAIAAFSGICHHFLYECFLRHQVGEVDYQVKYKSPKAAAGMTESAEGYANMTSTKESKLTFLYNELNRLGHNGEYERAIKTANKILHDNPDEVKAFHCKIVSLIQLSKFQEGLNFITKNTKLSSGLIFEKAYCQYRLNQPQEALKTIECVSNLTPKLKELKSQILYRMERYEECLEVYGDIIKNSSDDYEDERETNLAAVVANLSFGNFKDSQDLPQLREHTYELAYNRACRLLGERKWSETEAKLRQAERLCRETLEEDGTSEEDVEEELAIIKIQLAYCLQAQDGRGKEAQMLYNSVLQSTRQRREGDVEGSTQSGGLDPSLVAVASNNLVAFNRDGNVFDSKKRMRAAMADGLEHRLTSWQRACIALNNCLLTFYTNQADQCKQLCEKLAHDCPEFATEAVLIQASVLAREGKTNAGVELLRGWSSKGGSGDVKLVMQLASAQLLLSEGKLSEACKILLSLGETTFKPGVVSALVALSLASGDRKGASEVLKQAVEWYRKNKAGGADLRLLWRHAADFHLRSGDAAVAARSLEELLRIDPKDTKTMAQLVIAFSKFDPKKAQALSKKLPSVKGDSAIDVDALETSNWTMGTKVIKKTAASGIKDIPSPGNKPSTPGEELLLKVQPKRPRRRKGKLPKHYDPEATPDPERWLPRHERSGFRKKKDRRTKDVVKGTQGAAASGASDLYDITKMQPTAAALSPNVRHGSPGEVVGPRQQQRKGQQQQKKKRKGGAKW
ncbi:signal recognition particle subunit SRP72 [Hetaerina americana]|uniref:signal recognition particle subunit SRP72 n=1 Tax=Hetaerina americana TaxID=62018 RepID=UPI003A7F5DF2